MTGGYEQQVLEPWVGAVEGTGMLVYLLAAACLVCVAMAVWVRHRCAQLGDARAVVRWSLLAAAWMLLAAAFAWRLDVLLGGMMRFWIKQAGWYPNRHMLQIAALIVMALVVAGLARWVVRGELLSSWPPGAEQVFMLASLAILAVLLMRVSSLHAIDALLSQRLLGASAGRWAECGLLALALGAGGRAVTRY